jgi:hypothetical protein
MSLKTSHYGTDWKQILEQVTKKHVPVELVKEIQFIYQGEVELRLCMADLDSETLMAFGRSLYENKTDDFQIKLMVDACLLEKEVTQIVNPILKDLPRRI